MAVPAATLILADRKPGRTALTVLAGAVLSHPETRGVAVREAKGREALLDACRGALRSGRPALVAWSFYSSSFGEAAGDLEWLRERAAGPALLHVAGGPHATAEPGAALRAGFDLAAEGEGERTLVGLLARLGRGQSPRGRGLAWLEGGALRRGGPAEPVDLDAFPPFAPGLRRLGPIEITRGCVHACRFCQASFLFGARPRHRSVEAVAGWVRAMARGGARDVRFVTPSALAYGSGDGSPRLDRVEALLEAVREAAGPHGRIYLGSFPSEIRPEHVTPEALRLLRRFVANDNLVIGAQSGSDRMLSACHRGHSAEDALRAARLAVEAGFRARVDLIFGLPGETPQDAALTRRFMEDLAAAGAEVHGHAFLPLPGTPWRGQAPGRLDAETRLRLERLASRRRAFGQWRRHEALAAALAARRP
jgi:B12-binding domain/radical SAM domain protein